MPWPSPADTFCTACAVFSLPLRITFQYRMCFQVTLFGACVTSWKQASGDEVLFMRPDALQILEGPDPKSKPISGGIPHCFPQASMARPPLHRP